MRPLNTTMFGISDKKLKSRCVVFERHPRWGPLLRREMGDCVTEVRSLDQCREILDTCQGCIFILQPSKQSQEAVIDFITDRSPRDGGSRFIVVRENGDASLHHLWFECGACHVVASIRSFEEVIGLVQRHVHTPIAVA